jgi:hypothetical protein
LAIAIGEHFSQYIMHEHCTLKLGLSEQFSSRGKHDKLPAPTYPTDIIKLVSIETTPDP